MGLWQINYTPAGSVYNCAPATADVFESIRRLLLQEGGNQTEKWPLEALFNWCYKHEEGDIIESLQDGIIMMEALSAMEPSAFKSHEIVYDEDDTYQAYKNYAKPYINPVNSR